MQLARQRKTGERFFPPIPDRHLNFISSSITWPLLRTARRYKNKFLKDSAFATTTIGNTPSPFFFQQRFTADNTRHRTTCTTADQGRSGNSAAQYKSLLGRTGIRRHKPHKTRSFTLSHRLSYLGTFLRSQFEVIPSFRVNHTSSNFSTPSKKWVLLSTIMLASDWDIIAQGLEGERRVCLARWQGLIWENLPWSAD